MAFRRRKLNRRHHENARGLTRRNGIAHISDIVVIRERDDGDTLRLSRCYNRNGRSGIVMTIVRCTITVDVKIATKEGRAACFCGYCIYCQGDPAIE